MASISLTGWPAGATVNAYAASSTPGVTYSGSSLGSGTADSTGAVTIAGLTDGGSFVATDGTRTRRFSTPPASVASSGAREQLVTVNAGALRPFQAALGQRASHYLNIAAIGDSIIEGQGVAVVQQRWLDLLTGKLRAAFQPAGIPVTASQPNYVPSYYVGGSLPAPAVLAGTPTVRTDYGPGGRSLGLVTGQSATFTVDGTAIDVIYAKQVSGGSLSVTVDGGTPTVITASQGSGVSDFFAQRITFAHAGRHTVLVAGNAAGTAIFDGLVVYNGDETYGIRSYDFGHSGQNSTGLISPQAVLNGTSAGLNALQPRLVIVCVGTNDYAATAPAIPSATTRTNVSTLITSIRAAVTGVPPTIVVVGYVERNTASGSGEAWSAYTAALRAAVDADTTGLSMFVDLSRRMPPVAGDLNSLYGDTVHPTTSGHQLIADIMFEELTQGLSGVDPAPAKTVVDARAAALGWRGVTGGVESIPRIAATTSTGLVSGQVEYCFVEPDQDLAVTKLVYCTRSTAGSGLTLGRAGLYSVAANGDLTLVARSANISASAAANTVYQPVLDTTGGYPASYTMKAGVKYAIGIVFVGTTAPSLLCANGGQPGALAALAPLICAFQSGQADLPTSVTFASLGGHANFFWAAALT